MQWMIGVVAAGALLLVAWRLLPFAATQMVTARGVQQWKRSYTLLPMKRWGIRRDVIYACGPKGSCKRDSLVLGFFEVADIRESRRR
jgi:hypothetical protein